MSVRTYQVKDVVRMAGVTVRTLHHYDQIGLLVPSRRTAKGYRVYDDEDLLRLQQILIGRELGLSLEDIRKMLDDPKFDRKTALTRQREQLKERARNTEAMIRAVDAALSALENTKSRGGQGKAMDMKKIFDGFDPAVYEKETKERWGNTDAYKESQRRTKRYTEEDWRKLKAEADNLMKEIAAARQAGKMPGEVDVMDLCDRHRQHIDRWFYPCSRTMHAGLADLYESDPRFAANIDKYGEGLTAFFSAAIRANAKRV